MKARLRKLLILLAIFVPTVVLLVEFNKFMKRQDPRCATGECRRPDGYGLVIDPFPEEIVPVGTDTNQINEETENE